MDLSITAAAATACDAPERIERPSREQFLALARQARPFIVDGVVGGWTCSILWTDEHLCARLAGRKFLVNVSPDGLFGIFSSRMHDADALLHLSFAEFLQRVHECGAPGADGPVHYLQQKPVAQAFPELLPEIEHVPFIDPSALTQTNLWIGQRGSRIPLHFDSYDNLLAQVRGRKHIRLYGPQQTPLLYPGLDGAEFASPVDPERPDLQRFPLFRQARCDMEFSLCAGELLYLPPFWWHSIRAESNANISINDWYDTAFGDARAPLDDVRAMARIVLDQIRRLPAAQHRQALALVQQACERLAGALPSGCA